MDDPEAEDPGAAGAGRSARRRWADALAAWAIPDEILRAAPESPWAFPPGLFMAAARSAGPDDPSTRAALDALDATAGDRGAPHDDGDRHGATGIAAGTRAPAPGTGADVLDVGCGGGAAGLALAPPATTVTGVDSSPDMLAAFAAEASARAVGHREILGVWPDVAPEAPVVDVVVCHHVVYNVAAIGPFVAALAAHARRRVVVELTGEHPSVPLGPLWRQFWGLRRPDGPTADLFVEVVREAGFHPQTARRQRPVVKAGTGAGPATGPDDEYVAFVRRRLCLEGSRDPEVRAALAAHAPPSTTAVTVWWDTAAPG